MGGKAPIIKDTKVYCRIDHEKRKNAYTKIEISTKILNSNTKMGVACENGISRTNSAALSVVPMRASKPPMIRMVVLEKNAGVLDRVWVMMPSSTRGSRVRDTWIQRKRNRLVAAKMDGRLSDQRVANWA